MEDPEIVSSEDTLGGEPRLDGTRIGVSHIVQYYEKGWSVEKIAREMDLDPLEVVKALEYYYKNPKMIRKIIRERDEKGGSFEEKSAGEKA